MNEPDGFAAQMGVIVRQAFTTEHGPLEALQRRASLANPGDREAILSHPDAIEIPSGQIEAGHVFVAETAGGLAGFAAIVLLDDGAGVELDALFVEPDQWRRGIGRMLVEHCADFARIRGATALCVTGNPHAEGFYRSCGFEVTGTISTRFGEGLALRLPL
jgi:GNAT superfamily N-acetyltransferase